MTDDILPISERTRRMLSATIRRRDDGSAVMTQDGEPTKIVRRMADGSLAVDEEPPLLPPDPRMVAAFHEAGHASPPTTTRSDNIFDEHREQATIDVERIVNENWRRIAPTFTCSRFAAWPRSRRSRPRRRVDVAHYL